VPSEETGFPAEPELELGLPEAPEPPTLAWTVTRQQLVSAIHAARIPHRTGRDEPAEGLTLAEEQELADDILDRLPPAGVQGVQAQHQSAGGAGSPAPAAGKLAHVEIKGFRDLGICRVTEGSLAGLPMVHVERTPMSHPDFEGDIADFPPDSLHFVTWVPETALGRPEPQRALPLGAGSGSDLTEDDGDPWATGDGGPF
jgi:hypothetical protein